MTWIRILLLVVFANLSARCFGGHGVTWIRILLLVVFAKQKGIAGEKRSDESFYAAVAFHVGFVGCNEGGNR